MKITTKIINVPEVRLFFTMANDNNFEQDLMAIAGIFEGE